MCLDLVEGAAEGAEARHVHHKVDYIDSVARRLRQTEACHIREWKVREPEEQWCVKDGAAQPLQGERHKSWGVMVVWGPSLDFSTWQGV